jgi:hypothetical protein
LLLLAEVTGEPLLGSGDGVGITEDEEAEEDRPKLSREAVAAPSLLDAAVGGVVVISVMPADDS